MTNMVSVDYEWEEEDLDDPITLMDVEQFQAFIGLDAEIIDLESDEEPVSMVYTSPTNTLSAAFVQSSVTIRNTTSTDKLKPVSIKLVDCGKYPWYYKKHKKQIIERTLSNSSKRVANITNQEVISIDVKESNKTSHIATVIVNSIIPHADEQMCVDKVYKTPDKRENKHREDIKLQQALSQRNLTIPINYKKNKGLVGMKIRRLAIDEKAKENTEVEVKKRKLDKRQRKQKKVLTKPFVKDKAASIVLHYFNNSDDIKPKFIKEDEKKIIVKHDHTQNDTQLEKNSPTLKRSLKISSPKLEAVENIKLGECAKANFSPIQNELQRAGAIQFKTANLKTPTKPVLRQDSKKCRAVQKDELDATPKYMKNLTELQSKENSENKMQTVNIRQKDKLMSPKQESGKCCTIQTNVSRPMPKCKKNLVKVKNRELKSEDKEQLMNHQNKIEEISEKSKIKSPNRGSGMYNSVKSNKFRPMPKCKKIIMEMQSKILKHEDRKQTTNHDHQRKAEKVFEKYNLKSLNQDSGKCNTIPNDVLKPMPKCKKKLVEIQSKELKSEVKYQTTNQKKVEFFCEIHKIKSPNQYGEKYSTMKNDECKKNSIKLQTKELKSEFKKQTTNHDHQKTIDEICETHKIKSPILPKSLPSDVKPKHAYLDTSQRKLNKFTQKVMQVVENIATKANRTSRENGSKPYITSNMAARTSNLPERTVQSTDLNNSTNLEKSKSFEGALSQNKTFSSTYAFITPEITKALVEKLSTFPKDNSSIRYKRPNSNTINKNRDTNKAFSPNAPTTHAVMHSVTISSNSRKVINTNAVNSALPGKNIQLSPVTSSLPNQPLNSIYSIQQPVKHKDSKTNPPPTVSQNINKDTNKASEEKPHSLPQNKFAIQTLITVRSQQNLNNRHIFKKLIEQNYTPESTHMSAIVLRPVQAPPNIGIGSEPRIATSMSHQCTIKPNFRENTSRPGIPPVPTTPSRIDLPFSASPNTPNVLTMPMSPNSPQMLTYQVPWQQNSVLPPVFHQQIYIGGSPQGMPNINSQQSVYSGGSPKYQQAHPNMHSFLYNSNLQQILKNTANMSPGIGDVLPNYWPYAFHYPALLPPPPPPPPLPPPPLPPPLPLLQQDTSTRPSDNNSIIGRNINGLVRKINIPALSPNFTTNNEIDSKESIVKVENLDEGNTSPPYEVSAAPESPVASKTEMMQELERAMTVQSPVKSNFKRPLTNEPSPIPSNRFEPGPALKKFKFNDGNNKVDQNYRNLENTLKEPEKLHQGYSPPILPIPTYQNILTQVQTPVFKTSIVAHHDSKISPPFKKRFVVLKSNLNKKINKPTTGYQNESAKNSIGVAQTNYPKEEASKKISLEEYKKRNPSN